MGYDPTAHPPRGEVCIRGPTLFSGYYKEQGLTDECMGGRHGGGWDAQGCACV